MSTEIPVDDETRAALLLFNERLEETAAADRAAKRVAKAERAKDEAAARVRKLGDDGRASAEEKAEAEEAYKAAVAEFNRISADPTADEPKSSEPESGDDAEEAPAEEASAEDAPAEAAAADEAPAEEAPAEEPAAEPELAEVSADEEQPAANGAAESE